ncbi:hypothetical protein [Neokomagataea thailandica]|uniref:Uncharacterized protein n=1 Tax=Neokomagataea tanensis NBRC 106556 TaxID=1223519 RepID=A0ABQ0QL39_9PROT|nr:MULTISPECIES: hypothetical protein [Neokomagataea]GBR48746.1 hypothetical protein AA106556_1880 [Neokomagataea tanensis NBRC 106556]
MSNGYFLSQIQLGIDRLNRNISNQNSSGISQADYVKVLNENHRLQDKLQVSQSDIERIMRNRDDYEAWGNERAAELAQERAEYKRLYEGYGRLQKERDDCYTWGKGLKSKLQDAQARIAELERQLAQRS